MTEDPIELAWTKLRGNWDDDAAHKAFVGLAVALQRLPDAARHYRESVADEALQARAKAGIDAVLRVAMLSLTPPKRDPHAAVQRTRRVLGRIAAGMLVVVGTLWAARGFQASQLASFGFIAVELAVVFVVPWERLTGRGA